MKLKRPLQISCILVFLFAIHVFDMASYWYNTDNRVCVGHEFATLRIKGQSNSQQRTDGRIPKIIHQTWKNNKLPGKLMKFAKSWVKYHPDWEYWFWNDTAIRNLVATKFPSKLEAFDSIPSGSFKSVLAKYFMVYEFGGVFADLDLEALKPIDELVDQHHCFVGQESKASAVFNWGKEMFVSDVIVGCRPKHPMFKMMVDSTKKYPPRRFKNELFVLFAAGPGLLYKVYAEYHQNASLSLQDRVYAVEPKYMMPIVCERIIAGIIPKCPCYIQNYTFQGKVLKCERKRLFFLVPELKQGKFHPMFPTWVKMCDSYREGFVQGSIEEAYTLHHYSNTWMSGDPLQLKMNKLDPIDDLHPTCLKSKHYWNPF